MVKKIRSVVLLLLFFIVGWFIISSLMGQSQSVLEQALDDTYAGKEVNMSEENYDALQSLLHFKLDQQAQPPTYIFSAFDHIDDQRRTVVSVVHHIENEDGSIQNYSVRIQFTMEREGWLSWIITDVEQESEMATD